MNILNTLRRPYFSAFLSILVFFVSCSQYDDIIPSNKFINKSERILSNIQIEKLGEMHNKYLTNTINIINSTSKRGGKMTAKEAILSFNISELNREQKEYLYEKHSKIDIASKKEAFKISSKYINMIDEVFKNFNHHRDIITKFKLIKQKAQKELIGQDLENVLILLSVGENSSKFWLPIEYGGDGLGFEFLSKNNTKKNLANKDHPKWLSVFWHDMFGGLEGAVGWALGIAIAGGPVTLTAYLVAIGFGAAVSSIVEAIN